MLTKKKSRKYSIAPALILLIFMVFILSQCWILTKKDADELEQKVFRLINEHRVSLGMKELEWRDVIAEQCRIHSQNMASGTVSFGHSGFNQRCSNIATIIPYSKIEENVASVVDVMAMSYVAEKAVKEWLKNPSHRIGIEGDFLLTGVGVAINGPAYYFTQIFVKPH
ncbi:MAG: CAP domain-containing protein [Candidatus Aminicenantes bacterium]|nr:CAP domain-containing protein [Candidatus Aminicenantes bacterium]